MKKNIIKSINEFRYYMESAFVPETIRNYCSRLNGDEWNILYKQAKEPMQFLKNFDGFIYYFEKIMYATYYDLSYEIYLHDFLNQTIGITSIKKSWRTILDKRYENQIDDFIAEQRDVHIAESINLQLNMVDDEELPF